MNSLLLSELSFTISQITILKIAVLTLHLLFFNELVHLPLFRTVHYHFWGYQVENLKMVSQQYRAWTDCTNVPAGLALYWWQRLITFGSSRLRVNKLHIDQTNIAIKIKAW